jgi:hypothetical protein
MSCVWSICVIYRVVGAFNTLLILKTISSGVPLWFVYRLGEFLRFAFDRFGYNGVDVNRR